MDVAVHRKSGQRRRPSGRPSVLGDGLLERARATSLGLLGLTAAVGLAIVALALNQDWPLIAGSPIPPPEPKHQAVGDASVAATPGGGGALRVAIAAGPQGSTAFARSVPSAAAGTSPPAGQQPPGSQGFVVSDSIPASQPAAGAAPSPPPAAPQPASPTPAAPPAPAPAASSPAQPPVVAVSATPSQPPASSAGAPSPDASEEEPVDEENADGDCPPENEADEDEAEGDSGHGHSYDWHRGHGHDRW